MSERRWLEPPELEEFRLEPLDWPSPLEDDDPDPVEYFVDVLELEVSVTSVPKSVQFEQTSSFAPSTLMVFGDDVSAPHISH
jgi:hypothetical protein